MTIHPTGMWKPKIYIALKDLTEARDWKIGQTYTVEMKLKQVSLGEDEAAFEIVKATAIDNPGKDKKVYASDTGVMKA